MENPVEGVWKTCGQVNRGKASKPNIIHIGFMEPKNKSAMGKLFPDVEQW